MCPPRGLSKNECTDFQHARSNISVCASESPENRDFRELSRNYESVSQKQHFEKNGAGRSEENSRCADRLYGKLRRNKTKFRGRNESDSYYENTFKNNIYNVHDFAKRQALSVCALTVAPDNERQSVRRIEAAAPAAVAGNRKHRRF